MESARSCEVNWLLCLRRNPDSNEVFVKFHDPAEHVPKTRWSTCLVHARIWSNIFEPDLCGSHGLWLKLNNRNLHNSLTNQPEKTNRLLPEKIILATDRKKFIKLNLKFNLILIFSNTLVLVPSLTNVQARLPLSLRSYQSYRNGFANIYSNSIRMTSSVCVCASCLFWLSEMFSERR